MLHDRKAVAVIIVFSVFAAIVTVAIFRLLGMSGGATAGGGVAGGVAGAIVGLFASRNKAGAMS